MKKVFLLLTLGSALLLATDSGVIFGLKDNGSLALRKSPIKGDKIGKLSNGDKLTILKTEGKWHKVTVISTGKTGWTHGDWVKIFPKKSQTASSTKSVPTHIKSIPTTSVIKKITSTTSAVSKSTKTPYTVDP